MPDLFLERRTLGDPAHLPRLCVVCGGRPARPKKVTFSYQPYFWLSFLTRITVLRMQDAWVPLCNEHWNYFRRLNLVGLIGALALVLVIVGTIVGVVTLPGFGLGIALGGVFLLVAGTVALFVLLALSRQGKVRTTQIDDRGLLLVNVSPKFAEAVEDREDEPRRDEREPRRAERRREPAPSRGGMWLFLVLGGVAAGVVLFLLCGVGGIVLLTRVPAPQRPGPDAQTLGPPINPAWDEKTMTRVYLSEMEEIEPVVGYGKFGKNGMLGYGIAGVANSPIAVDGRNYPKALSTAPPANGSSSVKYRLSRTAKLFHAWVAINDVDDDRRTASETPLRFRVVGDGKLLWVSAPVQAARTMQECRVNVENVDWLELRVECQGTNNSARAVWLEPQVLK